MLIVHVVEYIHVFLLDYFKTFKKIKKSAGFPSSKPFFGEIHPNKR
jgi:hypothetical protein